MARILARHGEVRPALVAAVLRGCGKASGKKSMKNQFVRFAAGALLFAAFAAGPPALAHELDFGAIHCDGFHPFSVRVARCPDGQQRLIQRNSIWLNHYNDAGGTMCPCLSNQVMNDRAGHQGGAGGCFKGNSSITGGHLGCGRVGAAGAFKFEGKTYFNLDTKYIDLTAPIVGRATGHQYRRTNEQFCEEYLEGVFWNDRAFGGQDLCMCGDNEAPHPDHGVCQACPAGTSKVYLGEIGTNALRIGADGAVEAGRSVCVPNSTADLIDDQEDAENFAQGDCPAGQERNFSGNCEPASALCTNSGAAVNGFTFTLYPPVHPLKFCPGEISGTNADARFTGVNSPNCGECVPRSSCEANAGYVLYRLPHNDPENFGNRENVVNCGPISQCESVNGERAVTGIGSANMTCAGECTNSSHQKFDGGTPDLIIDDFCAAPCSENQRTTVTGCVDRVSNDCSENEVFREASDGGGGICECPEGYVDTAADGGVCVLRTPAHCAILGQEFVAADAGGDGGTCRECEENEISADGAACECPSATHITSGESCHLPTNSSECREVDETSPIHAAEEDDNCRAATDNAECAGAYPNLLPIRGDDGSCRAPRTNAECAATYPDRPVFGSGEENNCRASGAGDCAAGMEAHPVSGDCVSVCGANQSRNASGECECAEGYEAEGAGSSLSCSLPMCPSGATLTAGECVCDDENHFLDLDGDMCRIPRSSGECMSVNREEPILDGSQSDRCRPARNDGDCRLKAVAFSPPNALVVMEEGGSCRLPATHSECMTGHPTQPIYDERESDNCREAASDAECQAAHPDFPVQGSGGSCEEVPDDLPENSMACRDLNPRQPIYEESEPDNCRPSNGDEECAQEFSTLPIMGMDGSCRLPENSEECRSVLETQPIYDPQLPSNCRSSGTDADCLDEYGEEIQSLDGSCRLPGDSEECARANGMEPIYEESEPDNCRAAESDGECMGLDPNFPIQGADGSCIAVPDDLPADSAACRVLNPLQPIHDASQPDNCRPSAGNAECAREHSGFPIMGMDGSCRLPENSEECLTADSTQPIHDSEESDNCRAAENDADCRREHSGLPFRVADGSCRLPSNGEECRMASLGDVYENGACAPNCGEGSIGPENEAYVCRPLEARDCTTAPNTYLPTGSPSECRAPQNGSECRARHGGSVADVYESQQISASGGPCVTSCDAGRVANAAPYTCQSLEQSTCTPTRQVFDGGSCRDPVNGTECGTATGEMLLFYNPGEAAGTGECVASCQSDDLDREVGPNSVCRDRELTDCADNEYLDADLTCQNPTTGLHCRNRKGAGENNMDFLEGTRCQNECNDGRIPDVNFVCQDPTPAQCLAAGMILATGRGSCRAPENGAECAVATGGAMRVFDSAEGCVAACPAEKAADENNNCERCDAGEYLDSGSSTISATCRPPRNGTECRTAEGATGNEVYHDGACALSCPPGQAPNLVHLCVDATTIARCGEILEFGRSCITEEDCQADEFSRPNGGICECLYGEHNAEDGRLICLPQRCENVGECDFPIDSGDCARLDDETPIYENGVCRALMEGECAGGQILVSGTCQRPADGQQCADAEDAAGENAGFIGIEDGLCVAACRPDRAFIQERMACETCPDDYENVSGVCAPICGRNEVRQGTTCFCARNFERGDNGICEACPEGATSEPGGACFAPVTCVGGTLIVNNCFCSAGMENIDGRCVSFCRDDQERQDNGTCACPPGEQEFEGICADPIFCRPDQERQDDNTCACPSGEQESRLLGCVAPMTCRPDQELDAVLNSCGCPAGEQEMNGVCAVLETCRPDQERRNDICVCPSGEQEFNGVCAVPADCRSDEARTAGNTCVCPFGQEESDGVCVASCRPDQERQNGVCACPSGEQEFVGACAAPRSCPPDEELKLDNTCGCPAGQLKNNDNACVSAIENLEAQIIEISEQSESSEAARVLDDIIAGLEVVARTGDEAESAEVERVRMIAEETKANLERSQAGSGGGGGGGGGAAVALIAVPVVLIGGYWLLGGFEYIDPAYDFRYSGENGDLEWIGSAGFNLRHGGLRSYVSAIQSSGDAVSYESGMSYERDFLSLTYDAAESESGYLYDLGASVRAEFGLWTIAPAAAADFQYRRAEDEWDSESSAGLTAAWTAHRWKIRARSDFTDGARHALDLELQF